MSSLGGSLSRGHLLSLSLLETLVGVVVLEFTEADELGAIIARYEHFRVIDHEDEPITLLDGHSGDASKLLHTKLGKGFTRFFLASV